MKNSEGQFRVLTSQAVVHSESRITRSFAISLPDALARNRVDVLVSRIVARRVGEPDIDKDSDERFASLSVHDSDVEQKRESSLRFGAANSRSGWRETEGRKTKYEHIVSMLLSSDVVGSFGDLG